VGSIPAHDAKGGVGLRLAAHDGDHVLTLHSAPEDHSQGYPFLGGRFPKWSTAVEAAIELRFFEPAGQKAAEWKLLESTRGGAATVEFPRRIASVADEVALWPAIAMVPLGGPGGEVEIRVIPYREIGARAEALVVLIGRGGDTVLNLARLHPAGTQGRIPRFGPNPVAAVRTVTMRNDDIIVTYGPPGFPLPGQDEEEE